MAKKKESVSGATLLTSLQKAGWFRKFSDRYQVGIPDFLGCYRGITFGIELKAVGEIGEDGFAPAKTEHRFTDVQVRELKNITDDGGVGLGVIICGKSLFWFTSEYINENGQVDCKQLIKDNKMLEKLDDTWDNFVLVLKFLWELRIKMLREHVGP